MLTRPSLLLRVEELLILAGAVCTYSHARFSWLMFAGLFLAPDIFMLGYLANPRIGAALYNLGHWLAFPVLLLAFGYSQAHPTLLAIFLIWIAHIALDRTLGYGLKYPTVFKDTHLQRIA